MVVMNFKFFFTIFFLRLTFGAIASHSSTGAENCDAEPASEVLDEYYTKFTKPTLKNERPIDKKNFDSNNLYISPKGSTLAIIIPNIYN